MWFSWRSHLDSLGYCCIFRCGPAVFYEPVGTCSSTIWTDEAIEQFSVCSPTPLCLLINQKPHTFKQIIISLCIFNLQNLSTMGDKIPVKEVENFDKKKLRKTSTQERNTLPTQEVIEQEKRETEKGN